MSVPLSKQLSMARKDIRAFIQTHWSDQKLHDVYAFNADGKMRFGSTCCCLMGVTLTTPHIRECPQPIVPNHYFRAQLLPGGHEAENGYRLFGFFKTFGCSSDALRRVRLSALLRAEIRRRARKEAAAETARPRVTAEV